MNLFITEEREPRDRRDVEEQAVCLQMQADVIRNTGCRKIPELCSARTRTQATRVAVSDMRKVCSQHCSRDVFQSRKYHLLLRFTEFTIQFRCIVRVVNISVVPQRAVVVPVVARRHVFTLQRVHKTMELRSSPTEWWTFQWWHEGRSSCSSECTTQCQRRKRSPSTE